MIRTKKIILLGLLLLFSVLLIGSMDSLVVNANTAGPSITYDIQQTGWTQSKTITITITSAEELQTALINDLDILDNLTLKDEGVWEYQYIAQSNDNITLQVIDISDNMVNVTIYANELYIDNTIPEFIANITGKVNDWTNQNIYISFAQSQIVPSGYTYYYSRDNGEYQSMGSSMVFNSDSDNGKYQFKAVSGAGEEYILPGIEIMIDKESPNTPTADIKTDYYTELEVGFDLFLETKLLSEERVYYTIDGTKPNTSCESLEIGSTSITFPSNGIYTLRLMAIDAAGNESAVKTYIVRVDSTEYEIEFISLPQGGGELSGGGYYKRGDIVELSVSVNEGYRFFVIECDGDILTYDTAYSFTVEGSKSYLARFVEEVSIGIDRLEYTYDSSPKVVKIFNHDNQGIDLDDYLDYIEITYNGSTIPPSNAGEYLVTITLDHPEYYGYLSEIMTIESAEAEIEIDEETLVQSYGNISPIGVRVIEPIDNYNLTIRYNGSTALPLNAGTYEIEIIFESLNYQPIHITQYQLVIEKGIVSIVLQDKIAIYNGQPVAINPATSIPGNITLEYKYYDNEIELDAPPKNAGVYGVRAYYYGSDNYEGNESNLATLIITPRQLVIQDPIIETTKIYDGNTNVIEDILLGELGNLISGDSVTAVLQDTYYDEADITASLITVRYGITGDDSGNYLAPQDYTISAIINPRQLTVMDIDLDKSKVYDGNADVRINAIESIDGLIESDMGDCIVSGVAYYNSSKVLSANTITVEFTISGTKADNYITPDNLIIDDGVDIARLQLEIDAIFVTEKEYDGTDKATLAKLEFTNLIAGDDIDMDYIAHYNSPNVLEAYMITIELSILGDEDVLSNYIMPNMEFSVDGSITPIQLVIQDPNMTTDKVYDGTVDVGDISIGELINIIGDDSVLVDVGAAYYDKSDINASSITIEYLINGDDSGNYIAPQDYTISATITPKQLDVEGIDVVKVKVYDRNKNVEINNPGTIVGLVGEDEDVSLIIIDAAYDNHNVGYANSITIKFNIDGQDASNYIAPKNLIIKDGVDITPLQLAIQDIELAMKTYDGMTGATLSTLETNIIHGDIVVIDYNAYYNSPNVKDADKVTIDFTIREKDSPNYIAPQSIIIDGEISPLLVTIDYSNLSHTYDGEAKSANASIDNFDESLHAGFNINLVYLYEDTLVQDAINAGDYRVTLDMEGNDNYCYDAVNNDMILTIEPAQAYIGIENIYTVYDGSSPAISYTLTDNSSNVIEGIDVLSTYYVYSSINPILWQDIDWANVGDLDVYEWDEYPYQPMDAGAYRIRSYIETDNHYTEDTYSTLIIDKAIANISIKESSLNQIYGTVSGICVSTDPVLNDAEYDILYDDSYIIPQEVGAYSFVVTLQHNNYVGESYGIFTINQRVITHEDDEILILPDMDGYTGDMQEGYGIDYSPDKSYSSADFVAYMVLESLNTLELEIVIYLDDEIVQTIKDGGEYTIVASIDNANIVGQSSVVFKINKIEAEISYTPQSFEYTGEELGASGAFTTQPQGLQLFYYYSDDGSTYSPTAPIGVGEYTLKIIIDDINYYGEIYPLFTITKSSVQIILPQSIHFTYNGQSVNIEDRISFSENIIDQEVQYQFKREGVSEWMDVGLAPKDAGSYLLRVSYKNRDNFLYPDSDQTPITIGKATPRIELRQDINYVYDGEPKGDITADYYEITPNILTDVLFRFYRAEASDDTFIRGEELSELPINVGVYIVVAYIEDGGDNYSDAHSNDAILRITEGDATIQAVESSLTHIYDGDAKEIEIITNPAGLEYEITYIMDGVSVDEAILPGTYYVIVTIIDESYSGMESFVMVIDKQDISEEILFQGSLEQVYNGMGRTLVPFIEGRALDYLITYNGLASAPKNVGTYTVKATINDSIYKGSKTIQMSIVKAQLIITAQDKTLQYGLEDIVRYDYDGFVGNDSASSLTKRPTFRIINIEKGINQKIFDANITVGEYELLPEGAEAANYEFIYESGTLTIIKAPLTISIRANSSTINEGDVPAPMLDYSGFVWDDTATLVFGNNRPIVRYLIGDGQLEDILPNTAGVYRIIPDGGEAANYSLTYNSHYLIVNRLSLSSGEELSLTGSFHPNSLIKIDLIDKGHSLYSTIKSHIDDIKGMNQIKAIYDINVMLGNEPLLSKQSIEFKLLIPQNLRNGDFSLYAINPDGELEEIEYTIEGDYVVGLMSVSSSTIVFTSAVSVLFIAVLAGGVLLFILLTLSIILLKKYKRAEPKRIIQEIEPAIAAPLEALEDEDAAFDAYLEKVIQEKQEIEIIDTKDEEEDDIDLGINEEDYTPEEIERLKEKARKAKQLSVEDRITEQVERQLVESFSKTKKEIDYQEYAPTTATLDKDELSDDEEITDDYIINNNLFPNSKVIQYEEAKKLYPDRKIEKVKGKVMLELSFESALNLTQDKYKYIYSELKNSFHAYQGVESKMFKSGEAFKGGDSNAIIRLREGVPVILMNVDPQYIPEGTEYIDRSDDPKHQLMPIEIRVDNGGQLTSARKMISSMMVISELEMDPDYQYINYIEKYPSIQDAMIDEV